nr:uncharacterized protein LOC127329206 [Lolium perenne]
MPARLENMSPSTAFFMTADNTSIAATNSMGEVGSPCLSPLPWTMRPPGTPFTITLVFVVYRSTAIHLRNLSPNPIFLSTSNRKLQDSESKARDKSSLTRVAEPPPHVAPAHRCRRRRRASPSPPTHAAPPPHADDVRRASPIAARRTPRSPHRRRTLARPRRRTPPVPVPVPVAARRHAARPHPRPRRRTPPVPVAARRPSPSPHAAPPQDRAVLAIASRSRRM